MTREEAIDVLRHNYPSSCFEDLCKAVDIAIKALSAQPEPPDTNVGDMISRQATIDALCNNCSHVQAVCPHYPCRQYIEIESLPSAQPESSFVTWLLDEIWDEDMWEFNWKAFPEVLCRKLTKLGYIKEKDGEYERLDQQTGCT